MLDHAPQAQDVHRFLKAFRKQLDRRGLAVAGIGTDGSSLYPGPLARVTRGLPHLRTLRQIMDEVYRLFDRRCRTSP